METNRLDDPRHFYIPGDSIGSGTWVRATGFTMTKSRGLLILWRDEKGFTGSVLSGAFPGSSKKLEALIHALI
jgi:hypothetical protein